MKSFLETLLLIRDYEIHTVIETSGVDFRNKAILEAGAGSGHQLLKLKELSPNAVGIDVASSRLKEYRNANVIDYDGITFPFADGSFDIIYTSNTLEHIKDLDRFHRECHRVLKDGGCAVHVLPTHIWRIWTSIIHYIALPQTIIARLKRTSKAGNHTATTATASKSPLALVMNILFASRHGERGNRFTEAIYFHPTWWEGNFNINGWRITREYDIGLFYTGYLFSRTLLSIKYRNLLSKILGSSCKVFVIEKA